jgi:hypothetical protein
LNNTYCSCGRSNDLNKRRKNNGLIKKYLLLKIVAKSPVNRQNSRDFDDTIKYGDGFKDIICENFFERLMLDFCLVDYYNSHIKSASGDLDFEFLSLPSSYVTVRIQQ